MNCFRETTDNIPGAENVETDCDVNAVAKTALEDKEFVTIMFVNEVKEEAFGETCVDGWDVLLK